MPNYAPLTQIMFTYIRIRDTIFLNITWFELKNVTKNVVLTQKSVAEFFEEMAEESPLDLATVRSQNSCREWLDPNNLP